MGACESTPAHRCAGSHSRHGHLPCSGGLCAIFELDSNILLLPTLLAAFWLLRWRVGSEVSVSQTAFLFAVSGVMTAVCTLLSTVLTPGLR